MSSRRTRILTRIAGAALLGAATILVPKADPTEHWATPVEVVEAVSSEQAPDPGDPLPRDLPPRAAPEVFPEPDLRSPGLQGGPARHREAPYSPA